MTAMTKGRRTKPTEREALYAMLAEEPKAPETEAPAAGACSRESEHDCIFLHGSCLFDLGTCSLAEIRKFFAAGLRVLDIEARARGLSSEQKHQLMVGAFDVFHDAASGLWLTLEQMMRSGAHVYLPPHRTSLPRLVTGVGGGVESAIVHAVCLTRGGEKVAPIATATPQASSGMGQAPPPPAVGAPAPDNPALAGLRRALLRRTEQVKAYHEEVERDLDAIVGD